MADAGMTNGTDNAAPNDSPDDEAEHGIVDPGDEAADGADGDDGDPGEERPRIRIPYVSRPQFLRPASARGALGDRGGASAGGQDGGVRQRADHAGGDLPAQGRALRLYRAATQPGQGHRLDLSARIYRGLRARRARSTRPSCGSSCPTTRRGSGSTAPTIPTACAASISMASCSTNMATWSRACGPG